MALRAVQPGDAKPKPKTISQAADDGTTRELLVALRTRVARAVESSETLPRDLAALTRRLQEITRDIEAIDAEAEDGDSSAVEDEAFDPEAL